MKRSALQRFGPFTIARTPNEVVFSAWPAECSLVMMAIEPAVAFVGVLLLFALGGAALKLNPIAIVLLVLILAGYCSLRTRVHVDRSSARGEIRVFGIPVYRSDLGLRPYVDDFAWNLVSPEGDQTPKWHELRVRRSQEPHYAFDLFGWSPRSDGRLLKEARRAKVYFEEAIGELHPPQSDTVDRPAQTGIQE